MERKISIIWQVDDVLAQDPTLTEEQACMVLERLKNKHDANIGINWDVITDTILIMREEGLFNED